MFGQSGKSRAALSAPVFIAAACLLSGSGMPQTSGTPALERTDFLAIESFQKGVAAERGEQSLIPVSCKMTWRLNLTGAPAGFKQSVYVVAQETRHLTGAEVEISTLLADPPEGTTVVDFYWSGRSAEIDGAGAYAYTARPTAVPVVLDARVVFTPEALGKRRSMVRNILRHEVGHLLGLPHNDSPGVHTMGTSVYRLSVIEDEGKSPWTESARDDLAEIYSGRCPAR